MGDGTCGEEESGPGRTYLIKERREWFGGEAVEGMKA